MWPAVCGPEVLFETCVAMKFVDDDDDDVATRLADEKSSMKRSSLEL